ncbi:DUF5590 domain-containing protein [Salipaludibacillus sp. HK11]|uniref:cell wall elongation regulator TseB-like domain-containing protein n=1 Tax=Salipaludibacillus sp. HK11 TaxID=3394320 RepID=UPI0039FDA746
MKAWIISISVILLATVIGLSYYLYEVTADPIRDRQDEAITLAGETVDFSEVREVNYYHGSKSYQIIDAVDDEGNDIYIWVEEIKEIEEIDESEETNEIEESEESEEAKIEVRLQSEGLTKQEVIEIVQDELIIERLKSVRLGMIGSTPVYEVNYIDDEDRHSFYYLTFAEGTYMRHYQFLS